MIADASITVGSTSNVAGQLLAGTGATGAVTMAGSGGNTIGGCSGPPLPPPPSLVEIPALDRAGMVLLMLVLGGAALFVLRRRRCA